MGTMRSFFIEEQDIINDTIVVRGSEAHHIGRVLRFKKNDSITLFDKNGTTYSGIIMFKTKGEIQIRIIERQQNDQIQEKEIILAHAVTKSKKMDFVIQKCTELGVTSVIPFFSSRSVPRWDAEKSANKVAHWKRIVAASIKQSGIRKMPVVEKVFLFSDLLEQDLNGFLKLVFWEGASEQSLRMILAEQGTPRNIIFIVGPEGGFSDDEISCAKEKGFIPVSLGKYILRTETVPIVVLSIIQYELEALG